MQMKKIQFMCHLKIKQSKTEYGKSNNEWMITANPDRYVYTYSNRKIKLHKC